MASSELWEPEVDKVRFHSRSADGTPRKMGEEWLPVLSRVKKASRLRGVKWALVTLRVLETVNVGPGDDEVGPARYFAEFWVDDEGNGDGRFFTARALSESELLKRLSDPTDEWDLECENQVVVRAYF